MNVISELSLPILGMSKTIYFGIPNTPVELEEMFKLRYNIYNTLHYFNQDVVRPPLDKDQYDLNGKCQYFIAKIDEKIIGTMRLIQDEFLPTEKDCFAFEEPLSMKEIARQNRGELGRLIVVSHDKNTYLPRNIVMLFLMYSVMVFSENKHILGGYSFITQKLYGKLQKLKFPFHLIEHYKNIYPRDGLLGPYFYEHGEVLPIYFFVKEAKIYLETLLDNKNMFRKESGRKYILRPTIYNTFLKILKIL